MQHGGAGPVDGGSRLFGVALHLVGCGVGAGMAILLWQHIASVGAGAPLIQDMLALDAHGRGPTFGSVARDSGFQLLSFAALASATGAALALLLAAGLALTGPKHHRTAQRLATFGLWLALLVCLVAMLPLPGYPFAPEVTTTGDGVDYQWAAAPKALAIAAVAGLLCAAIATRPGRRGERAASAG